MASSAARVRRACQSSSQATRCRSCSSSAALVQTPAGHGSAPPPMGMAAAEDTSSAALLPAGLPAVGSALFRRVRQRPITRHARPRAAANSQVASATGAHPQVVYFVESILTK